jgi:predicted dehydrogenase
MNEHHLFGKFRRRTLLKGLFGFPILGAAWWAGASTSIQKSNERKAILNTLNIQPKIPPVVGSMSGDPIRIGLIGFGSRGQHLARSMGYATNDWLAEMEMNAHKDPLDNQLNLFFNQEDLNVRITAVCDVFDVNANQALESFNTGKNTIKRYRTHQDLIESGEVDAVVIATPDHWHAPMAIDALNANIHVYVEKPMTHNLAETFQLRDAVLGSRAVFAVGHQHRQTQSFLTAQKVIEQNVLGHVSLIEANTNRNDDNGAWQYPIHKQANGNTIDWDLFLGNAPKVQFNKEHFFRWRKWWAYGSGLSGDLMTHDFDRINCVLNMGIPSSVTASGGIYTHRDGRTVPDVLQVNMEYPDFSTGRSQKPGKEKGMTLVYSATLGSQYYRPTVLMGHDASMELGNKLTIYADGRSTRYKDLLNDGKMDPSIPIYQYDPAVSGVDGISSATSKYFADKGLLWTYRDGKQVDSTLLHLKEWLSAIRNGGPVSCGIEQGFEEAITAHMTGISYKLGRKIEWDPVRQELVPIEGYDFDQVLLSDDLIAY